MDDGPSEPKREYEYEQVAFKIQTMARGFLTICSNCVQNT